ncbi:MAG: peptidyl-prolyl cis-trans isomerase [Deltaproteobacteria bacterium]|jgi:parvulin-like peptidyl-prolyl isomerase|nr:peptidyl-prolyl cis-trans isomerase [Deltaproteobacteria bacterium]MCW9049134.1 peptidyl-prolyl cis-trans isomerase [Deltaproteobacteria bacterium]MEE4253681.1 peptidyl-prolyl cis-trans isomerase [Desulfuromusa sp.]
MLTRILQVFLLVCLVACQQQEQQPEQAKLPLLEIGQRQLSLQQFEREIQLNYPDLSGLPDEQQLQLKSQLIKQLIDRELILGEAARLNVQISPDELDAALAEIRGSYSADEFDQVLLQTGKTYEAWVAALKLRLLTAKVSTAVLSPKIKVTDKEAEQYYLNNKEEFRRPVEIRARQMLFPSEEEALNVLKLLKDGGDFATLAQEHSHSPDSEKGGALGYFSKGQLPPEFDEILFKLPVRRLSDPVESPYGFHLFIVENRRRAGLRQFAAVKDEIKEKLYQEKEENAFHLWIEDLHKKTETIVRWELLQSQQTLNH